MLVTETSLASCGKAAVDVHGSETTVGLQRVSGGVGNRGERGEREWSHPGPSFLFLFLLCPHSISISSTPLKPHFISISISMMYHLHLHLHLRSISRSVR